MPKPTAWTDARNAEVRRRIRVLRGVTVLRKPGRRKAPPPSAVEPTMPRRRTTRVVAIGASTGGPVALATIVASLRGIQAPVLIVQHMHVDFVDGLVSWMARVATVPVRAAVHGCSLERGVVYIGPGDVHLKIGPGRHVVLDAAPLTTHRPSADQLFFSVAEHVGPDAIGVILTGMGDDGAAGLLAIRQRGGTTIAQDEETSVVFGMPKAAQLAGAATHVMPLDTIGPAIVKASMGLQL
jgi:two-component system chemotaxis response regulator CheB